MRYVSSEINPTPHTAANGSMYRLEIITAGTSDPLSLITLTFSEGKERKDTAHIKIYYTVADSVFSATNLFGKASRVDEIRGEQSLHEGSNYFWISSDLIPQKKISLDLKSFQLGRQDYKLVWSDEFNENNIDTVNWSFENGFVRNREVQWYQPGNARCSNGTLIIEARRETKPNPLYVEGSSDWRKGRSMIEYTSSSMHTRNKQQWQYGRFEMRARIDTVLGYWPAWWTLGTTRRWPSNGEIDIMEYYRGKLLFNYAVGTSKPNTAFWFSNRKDVSLFPADWKEKFHTWRMDWDEEGIGIYLDDALMNYQPQSNLYNRDSSEFYPFKQKHYMLLNLAIGGDNGGDPTKTLFPLKYEIDYVRVSQKIHGSYKHLERYKPGKTK